jgi:hypothetical protein
MLLNHHHLVVAALWLVSVTLASPAPCRDKITCIDAYNTCSIYYGGCVPSQVSPSLPLTCPKLLQYLLSAKLPFAAPVPVHNHVHPSDDNPWLDQDDGDVAN